MKNIVTINTRFSAQLQAKLLLIILIICALLMRYYSLPYVSSDFVSFLKNWYQNFVTDGAQALAGNFSNYPVAYLYLMYLLSKITPDPLIGTKIISLLFDLVMAYGVKLVISHYRPDAKLWSWFGYAVILLLPTVFINSALWAQCDGIYTSFLLYSFYFILKDRYNLAWLMWGLAMAFKIQAIFFVVFLFYVWLVSKKRQKWYAPLFSIVAFGVVLLPALIMGRPLAEILASYVGFIGYYEYLTLNALNFYQWIPNTQFAIMNKVGVVLTAALMFATIFGLLLKFEQQIAQQRLLIFATVTLIMAPYFLPQMHERYFYQADVFCVVLALIAPRYILPALLVVLISMFSYFFVLFGAYPPIHTGALAVVLLLVQVFYLYELFKTQQAGAAGSK